MNIHVLMSISTQYNYMYGMCQLAMHVSLQSASAEETSEETGGGQPVTTQANEVRLVA